MVCADQPGMDMCLSDGQVQFKESEREIKRSDGLLCIHDLFDEGKFARSGSRVGREEKRGACCVSWERGEFVG